MIEVSRVDKVMEKIESKERFFFSTFRDKMFNFEFVNKLLNNSVVVYCDYVGDYVGEALLRTKHPFYFYIRKNGNDIYKSTIYFEEEKKQELILFINLAQKNKI